jgi:hypothetical protein
VEFSQEDKLGRYAGGASIILEGNKEDAAKYIPQARTWAGKLILSTSFNDIPTGVLRKPLAKGVSCEVKVIFGAAYITIRSDNQEKKKKKKRVVNLIIYYELHIPGTGWCGLMGCRSVTFRRKMVVNTHTGEIAEYEVEQASSLPGFLTGVEKGPSGGTYFIPNALGESFSVRVPSVFDFYAPYPFYRDAASNRFYGLPADLPVPGLQFFFAGEKTLPKAFESGLTTVTATSFGGAVWFHNELILLERLNTTTITIKRLKEGGLDFVSEVYELGVALPDTDQLFDLPFGQVVRWISAAQFKFYGDSSSPQATGVAHIGLAAPARIVLGTLRLELRVADDEVIIGVAFESSAGATTQRPGKVIRTVTTPGKGETFSGSACGTCYTPSTNWGHQDIFWACCCWGCAPYSGGSIAKWRILQSDVCWTPQGGYKRTGSREIAGGARASHGCTKVEYASWERTCWALDLCTYWFHYPCSPDGECIDWDGLQDGCCDRVSERGECTPTRNVIFAERAPPAGELLEASNNTSPWSYKTTVDGGAVTTFSRGFFAQQTHDSVYRTAFTRTGDAYEEVTAHSKEAIIDAGGGGSSIRESSERERQGYMVVCGVPDETKTVLTEETDTDIASNTNASYNCDYGVVGRVSLPHGRYDYTYTSALTSSITQVTTYEDGEHTVEFENSLSVSQTTDKKMHYVYVYETDPSHSLVSYHLRDFSYSRDYTSSRSAGSDDSSNETVTLSGTSSIHIEGHLRANGGHVMHIKEQLAEREISAGTMTNIPSGLGAPMDGFGGTSQPLWHAGLEETSPFGRAEAGVYTIPSEVYGFAFVSAGWWIRDVGGWQNGLDFVNRVYCAEPGGDALAKRILDWLDEWKYSAVAESALAEYLSFEARASCIRDVRCTGLSYYYTEVEVDDE